MIISVMELADLLSARILPASSEGSSSGITGFATLREARQGDLSFFSDPRYRQSLSDTSASVVLVPVGWSELPATVTGLMVSDPSASFEVVVNKFGYLPAPAAGGVHASAVVAADVVPPGSSGISIGANAVVEAGVRLGNGVEIGAGCYVGRNVRLGNGCKLFPNATVLAECLLGERVILHSGVVIGADGFGYEFVNGTHRKVRQSGIVQIDDDVEIGACSTVDRARFGRTWIGKGTKIDNQVQVAHNVTIGKHCIVVAGTGIAGSAQIGDYVIIAAQAGIAGHVTVGSQCTIGARAGVTKNIPAGRAAYMGFPASPAAEERRRVVAVRRLPQLLERVKVLEKAALEQVPAFVAIEN